MSRLEEIIKTVTANGMREITVERAKQIAIEYAKECSQASLEKASENGLVEHRINGNSQKSQVIGNRHETFSIDKESIITPDNIVIL